METCAPVIAQTSSESGRLLALTMWRIPVEKGKGQKDKAHPGMFPTCVSRLRSRTHSWRLPTT